MVNFLLNILIKCILIKKSVYTKKKLSQLLVYTELILNFVEKKNSLPFMVYLTWKVRTIQTTHIANNRKTANANTATITTIYSRSSHDACAPIDGGMMVAGGVVLNTEKPGENKNVMN